MCMPYRAPSAGSAASAPYRSSPCSALPHPARVGVELGLVSLGLLLQHPLCGLPLQHPLCAPLCAFAAPPLHPLCTPPLLSRPPHLGPASSHLSPSHARAAQYETGESGNRFIGGTDRPRGFFGSGWVDVAEEGWEEHETGCGSVRRDTGQRAQGAFPEAPPWQGPSTAPALPQSAPGGSGRLISLEGSCWTH